MPTISTAGATVSYTTVGEGPGLVLVAGTGLAAQLNFGHVVDAFSDRHTVVLPTTPAAAGAAVDGPVDIVGVLARPEQAERLVATLQTLRLA